jgi:hypothetical protein
MAALVAAIHVFFFGAFPKTWMPGTRPGMTNKGRVGNVGGEAVASRRYPHH